MPKHDRRQTLVELLSEARDALLDCPPEKKAPLLAQADKLSAQLAALDRAASESETDADIAPAPGRSGAPSNVTALASFTERLAQRDPRAHG